jgi:hypothetical protein
MVGSALPPGQAKSIEQDGMPDMNWFALVMFMALVLSVSLYGLTVSGHFPSEHRSEQFRTGAGAAILCLSMAATAAASVCAVAYAARTLPWYAGVIGGGLAVLIAPLLLQPLPDSFVDGRHGLLAFAAASIVLAAIAWRLVA